MGVKVEKNIAVIPGDGIGPEITPEAVKVLNAWAEMAGHVFHYRHADMGGVAFDRATAGMSEKAKKAIDDWDDEAKRKLKHKMDTIIDKNLKKHLYSVCRSLKILDGEYQ